MRDHVVIINLTVCMRNETKKLIPTGIRYLTRTDNLLYKLNENGCSPGTPYSEYSVHTD